MEVTIASTSLFRSHSKYRYGGFLKWRYPNSSMAFVRENPNLKWMIWGYPHFRKPPYMDNWRLLCCVQWDRNG